MICLHLPSTKSTANKFILFEKCFHNRSLFTFAQTPSSLPTGDPFTQYTSSSLAMYYFVLPKMACFK